MSEVPEPIKSTGCIRTRVAWLLLTGLGSLVLGVAGVVIYPKDEDATPTVYHHADGTFSLNRQKGPAVTPEDVRTCLKEYESFGRVRLVCNPLTRLADWGPILNGGGEAGAPFYQIESDGKIFTFMLPGSACLHIEPEDEFNPMAVVINLSDAASPPLDVYPGSDVFILVDTATTCEEALATLSGHNVIDKSITIISADLDSDGVIFHHRKDEWIARPNSFKRRPSEFWTKHIQSTIDRLKSVF